MNAMILRMILSFISGYLICQSGSISQLLTNNKLSSPSTLGFTGIGVLSVLIAFFIQDMFQLSFALEYISVIVGLFLCSIYSLNLLKVSKGQKKTKLIILGIGFNLFIGGIFSIVQFLIISLGKSFPSSIWFGSFRFVEVPYLSIFIPIFILALIISLKFYKDLELINLGDTFTKHFGLNIDSTFKLLIIWSCLSTICVVSFFGVFSLIGLVFVHLLRQNSYFSFSVKNEFLYGPFIGGFILMVLDALCYHVPLLSSELPVGMICSIIGSVSLFFILFLSDNNSIKD
ncbi:MAG: iron ABC transporter permease [Bacteriovoracaceae bacterium]|jgi:iron complex transport system permease protein|nr:iron ABC transporter permease [Bacteriovoracaceae bacterium]